MTYAKFNQIQDIDEFACAIGIPSDRIQRYAELVNQAQQYHCLAIPKKGRNRSGEVRVVYKAKKEWLSQLHRSVSMVAVNSTYFGKHVQGFAKRRSIRTNAELHLGAKFLLHADIRNFFDSITTDQVELGLISVGAVPALAKILAKACTIDGFLRQGTRCSPVLANLVCRKVDSEMLSLAEVVGATYSRYADDITFSGDDVPDSESVETVLSRNGFELRDGHCYLQKRGRRQYVTGLTVVDTNGPRLPKRLKHRLRLVLHFIEKYGVEEHFRKKTKSPVVSSLQELEGMLCFVHAVEPYLAEKMFRKLQNAIKSFAEGGSLDS